MSYPEAVARLRARGYDDDQIDALDALGQLRNARVRARAVRETDRILTWAMPSPLPPL